MCSACLSSTGVPTKGNLRTRYLPKYQKSETDLKVPEAFASVSMDPARSTGDLTGQQVSKGNFLLLLRVHVVGKAENFLD